MKKLLAIMTLTIVILSLTACGGTTGSEIREPVDVITDNPVGQQTEAVEQTEGTQTPVQKEATIEETVLVDEAGVKITAKSLSGSLFGPEVKLLIENNSGKDLTFQTRNSSVNGYMVETMMSVDVVNGKKANDSLVFASSDLENCGIETIADMEFAFHIFDTETWADYLDTEIIQLKTSLADGYEYTFDDSGHVIFDDRDIRIVVKGLSEDDSIFGPGIVIYIENNSGKDITVQARDTSVNGFMIEAIQSTDVVAGKRAVDAITFMSSSLEENGITAFENAELSFVIIDANTWNTIVETEMVAMTF